MMTRCNYCNTPFSRITDDLGCGQVDVAAPEPACDCYDVVQCETCGQHIHVGEYETHSDHCISEDDY